MLLGLWALSNPSLLLSTLSLCFNKLFHFITTLPHPSPSLSRLSYKGLGEPLCFLAFGPSATPAFYLALQSPVALQSAAVTASAAAAAVAASTLAPPPAWLSWPATALQPKAVPALMWCLSALVGTSTTVILFTSHFHQIEGDRRAGKRSPLVRLGVERGVGVLSGCVIGLYGCMALMVAFNVLPLTVLGSAVLFSLGRAKTLVDFAERHKQEPAKLAILKRYACMWHITLGMSLALGLAVARAVRLLT